MDISTEQVFEKSILLDMLERWNCGNFVSTNVVIRWCFQTCNGNLGACDQKLISLPEISLLSSRQVLRKHQLWLSCCNTKISELIYSDNIWISVKRISFLSYPWNTWRSCITVCASWKVKLNFLKGLSHGILSFLNIEKITVKLKET